MFVWLGMEYIINTNIIIAIIIYNIMYLCHLCQIKSINAQKITTFFNISIRENTFNLISATDLKTL